jgi:hypothetical protein
MAFKRPGVRLPSTPPRRALRSRLRGVLLYVLNVLTHAPKRSILSNEHTLIIFREGKEDDHAPR